MGYSLPVGIHTPSSQYGLLNEWAIKWNRQINCRYLWNMYYIKPISVQSLSIRSYDEKKMTLGMANAYFDAYRFCHLNRALCQLLSTIPRTDMSQEVHEFGPTGTPILVIFRAPPLPISHTDRATWTGLALPFWTADPKWTELHVCTTLTHPGSVSVRVRDRWSGHSLMVDKARKSNGGGLAANQEREGRVMTQPVVQWESRISPDLS